MTNCETKPTAKQPAPMVKDDLDAWLFENDLQEDPSAACDLLDAVENVLRFGAQS